MKIFNFNSLLLLNISQQPPAELTNVFDVMKLNIPCEQSLFSNELSPVKNKSIKKITTERCSECDGDGMVEISDWVGKHHYEAECECQECDGDGEIELEQPIFVEVFAPIQIMFQGITKFIEFGIASELCKLNGKPCLIDEHRIWIDDSLV